MRTPWLAVVSMALMVGCSPESSPSKTGSRAKRYDPDEGIRRGDVRPPSPSPKRVCDVRESFLRRLGADDLMPKNCRSVVGRERREMGEDAYAEWSVCLVQAKEPEAFVRCERSRADADRHYVRELGAKLK